MLASPFPISFLISRLSRSFRDMSRSARLSRARQSREIEIRSISVRIDESKFARTDVPKGTSAEVFVFAGGTL